MAKQKIQLSDHFNYSRLLRFVLPCIGTMLFTSIYGIVDGLCVSNFVGKTAFAAVNLIMPLPQLLADSEVVFTCLNKNVLLLGENEFAQLGAGKVLFNTSIGPGFDSAALEKWLDLPGTHFFCDTRAAAGPVAEDFFSRENVRCANVSAGRTKQAFVLLSKKVLDNIRTALGE